MLKDVNLILLTIRLLLAFLFFAIAFEKPIHQRALLVFLTTLYVSLSLLSYLHPTKARFLKRFLDALVLLPICFIAGDKILTLSLLVPALFYANRDTAVSLTLFWAGILLFLYTGGVSSLYYLPLLFALFLASLSPDLVESIRKERYYIRKLRASYRELSKDLSKLEKESREKDYLSFIIDKAVEDRSPEDFLLHIKEKFSLKRIAIVPKGEITHKEAIIDKENTALYVPVFFEKGCAYVIFYFNTPFELYDREIITALEKSAKLLNLYIVGFDDHVKKDSVRLAV
ncbi:MAG: hypothetical protein KNN13_08485 [Hydrogenobacter thermophilus]|uniref:hypothetical protein n=1 Tax=Hydrogenobacter thermophilus TaxID=940 RepID=UPI001C73EFEB|nr:hypothetical protein [Hydrogenobacter thermophilus]QWK19513.1 MAG: hypothetical protein KNN13_08485 [Hydrogenobacter thermophilus]